MADAGERRLAAILSADVAGYSKLMADDERATVLTLTDYREVFTHHIARHKGRVIDSPGDNLLAEFASPVEAVDAAINIQNELTRRNRQLAEHRRMLFRIGINLGDIIGKDDGTIYGDGVNIAARLEGLAEPGGICLSETIFLQTEGKVAAAFEDIGSHEVKNITKPVRTYRVVTDVPGKSAGPPRGQRRRNGKVIAATALAVIATGFALWLETEPTTTETQVEESTESILSLPGGPAIAVLPFENLSDDQTQQYFADGLASDILTQLSFVSNYRIIGRASTFKYKGQAVDAREIGETLDANFVLLGSVRRVGDNVRITAELLDTEDGSQVWANTYDRALNTGNVFEIQDEVTQNVVATIADGYGAIPQYRRAERAERDIVDLGSWECVNLAFDYFEVVVAERHLRARECLEGAIERDPNYGDAWGWLAIMYAHEVAMGYNPLPNSLDRALDAGMRGVAVAPKNQMTWEGLAAAHFFRHSYEKFDAAAQTAVELNPNDASTLANMGLYYGFAGVLDKSVPLMDKAMALSPFHQNWYYFPRYFEAFDRGDYETALEMANKLYLPGVWWSLTYRAAVYSGLGQLEDAREDINESLKLFPQFPEYIRRLYTGFNFPTQRIENLVDALNQVGAGIPSKPETDS